MNKTTKRAPFIETYTGVRFRPLSPRVEDIRIHDIAHALSNQCRFSGHVRHFYSVAEHSVRVSRLLESKVKSPAIWLKGLLHDASEAYLVDLPTPLKVTPKLGTAYRVAEGHLMQVIWTRFCLPRGGNIAVAWADAAMLATEVRDLMFARPEHWHDLPGTPLHERIVPWSPKVAEDEFLRRFDELTIGNTRAA
jgi:hypothetical protein